MFHRITCLVFCILFFSACTTSKVGIFVKSFSPAIHKGKFTYADGTKALYFHKRNHAADNSPILFLIGGSGHYSAVYTIARFGPALHKINATVYSLQKRHTGGRETGMGKPGKQFIHDYYFTQMAADQAYFIKMILGKAENQHRKVILVGVSEGATIAAKVAAELPAIEYLGIIGGGGMQQSEELEILYADQKANLELFYDDIKKHPNALDSQAMGYTYKYWSEILFTDPMPWFLKLNIPVVVGNGELDENTPIASARLLKSAYEEQHKTNLVYLEYKDCDHTLNDKKGHNYLPDFFSKLDSLVKH